MFKLKVILGSTRPSRFSEKLVPWLTEQLGQKPEFEHEVLDLRDFNLPFYDQPISPLSVKDGAYGNEKARAWAQKIGEADAFLIVTPEYNHSVSAVLKNALDSVYSEWNRKPVAFVAYGSVGGARAVEHLRQISVELQMASVRPAVHIPSHWNLLDGQGNIKNGALDQYAPALQILLDHLLWWTRTLKAGRESE